MTTIFVVVLLLLFPNSKAEYHAKNTEKYLRGRCPLNWKPANDICYKFGKKPENFFNALRGCQNRVEPNAKILQQELKENPSLLLTLGKLREFFQDPYQSPTSHFNEKIRLNAIQFNRNWYEIHQVPPNSYVDLTKIHEYGQLIPPLDFEFFGLDYDMGKNRMGLVFDPKWGQLQLENFNEKFPYVCSHKREYRPEHECQGNVAECSDRGICKFGKCHCYDGYTGDKCDLLDSGNVWIVTDPSQLSKAQEELATFSTFGPEFLIDIYLKINPNFVGNAEDVVEILRFTDSIETLNLEYLDFENVLLLNVQEPNLQIDVQNDQSYYLKIQQSIKNSDLTLEVFVNGNPIFEGSPIAEFSNQVKMIINSNLEEDKQFGQIKSIKVFNGKLDCTKAFLSFEELEKCGKK